MNRLIKKQFWLNENEDKILKDKAKRTCLTEAGLLRFLILGYEPHEKPDEEFYDAMGELSAIADKMAVILLRSDLDCLELEKEIKDEISRWRQFQADIERRFLVPIDGRARWQ